jgi:hypothetical protein
VAARRLRLARDEHGTSRDGEHRRLHAAIRGVAECGNFHRAPQRLVDGRTLRRFQPRLRSRVGAVLATGNWARLATAGPARRRPNAPRPAMAMPVRAPPRPRRAASLGVHACASQPATGRLESEASPLACKSSQDRWDVYELNESANGPRANCAGSSGRHFAPEPHPVPRERDCGAGPGREQPSRHDRAGREGPQPAAST